MAKKKPTNPFVGRWRITWMSAWDTDYLDMEVEAFIEFSDSGQGEFQFGLVRGGMDCEFTTRDGKPAVEWSWEGSDEMDPVFGRGWAVTEEDQIKGMLAFHQGDASEFEAEKMA